MKPRQELISERDNTPGDLTVVAAVISRRGRWLLARRPPHKAHGGLWEFPGGKVDAMETLADALKRELLEELALAPVEVGELLGTQTASLNPENQKEAVLQELHLHFFSVATDSAPIALEHTALGWFNLEEAGLLDLAPLDRAFLENIRRASKDREPLR